ncbi:hypothetical protein NAEGRDRAFT_45919 [Naegleria gruberi]|uniref:N-acetyltransferase domain-containing protein n=1 Tax=Naegleria gruberi TaxID=5762 RepID=D2V1L8_NAEGR|nr:uncharacterized protein NAEGRDRAFT_45919 [Naegleria gruberi]EFC49334.1 hypothetical protein NAEGRDRAFT_45919 [Naegleria gruberi]|eukprot:XP_002682078.1 hypothetical protein NAEGRDRAFT_45919 [Naegleria gruberi strain NEG-M]
MNDQQFRIEEIAGSYSCSAPVEQKKVAAQIVHQGLAERFGDEYDESFNQDLNDLDANYLVFCAMFSTSNNEMIGTGALSLEHFTSKLVENNHDQDSDNSKQRESENEYCLRVGRVSVIKEYRRKGLAFQIMKYLISKAGQLYVKLKDDENKVMKSWLVVETDTPWIEAVELYKKLGFIQVCERDGCVHFKKEIEM